MNSHIRRVRIVWFGVALVTVAGLLFVMAGCSDSNNTVTEPELIPLMGSTVSAGDCKVFEDFHAGDGTGSDQDCIEFEYDGESVLSIKHINAAFNCCPDSFGVEVNLEGNVITIVEQEYLTYPCYCLCLYDMEYSVANVKPGTYTIRVIEPYLLASNMVDDPPGPPPLLQFSVDLRATPSGMFCVERNTYPWGINHTLEGKVTDYFGCKPAPSGGDLGGPFQPPNCFQYEYDGEGKLVIDHINAILNCCIDSVSINVSMMSDTLFIEDIEHASAPCRCVCEFDVSYEINDLAPGQYVIQIVGPYELWEDEPLVLDVDFTVPASGMYCVDRGEQPEEPVGMIMEYRGCKTFDMPDSIPETPSDQDCLQYQWDGGGTLDLQHINTALNCCPVVAAEITFEGFHITITELDSLSMGGCDCICLFDIDYRLYSLPPGEYTITVVEPYKPQGEEVLEVTVDLTAPTSGIHCVDRYTYPWND